MAAIGELFERPLVADLSHLNNADSLIANGCSAVISDD
jgi:hypothetical protein